MSYKMPDDEDSGHPGGSLIHDDYADDSFQKISSKKNPYQPPDPADNEQDEEDYEDDFDEEDEDMEEFKKTAQQFSGKLKQLSESQAKLNSMQKDQTSNVNNQQVSARETTTYGQDEFEQNDVDT